MSEYVDNHLIAGENALFGPRLHGATYLSATSICTLGLWALIARILNRYVVTNRRIIVKLGWLRQRSVEISVPKIESITVQSTFTSWMSGFGDIIVRGTGGTYEVFSGIAAAQTFREACQSVMQA